MMSSEQLNVCVVLCCRAVCSRPVPRIALWFVADLCHSVICMYSDMPTCSVEPLRVLQKTWKQMEQLVEEGLVKSIGISNFSVQKIQDLLKYAKIKPAVNQVELHPYFRNEKLHKYCDEQVMHSCINQAQSCSDQAVQLSRYNVTLTPNLLVLHPLPACCPA